MKDNGKNVSNIEFPLGKRILKTNTVLSLDGFLCCLSSGSIKDGRVGFLPLTQVYGMAKDDPARPAALQAASETACGAPLRMMELCLEALEAAERLADIGSRLAVSDAGCAAALLHGGLRAASLNVYINTKAMPDRDAAEGLNHRCGALLHRGTALADAVFDRVKRELTTL